MKAKSQPYSTYPCLKFFVVDKLNVLSMKYYERNRLLYSQKIKVLNQIHDFFMLCSRIKIIFMKMIQQLTPYDMDHIRIRWIH